MKEIKFRVWDKITKQMCLCKEIIFALDGTVSVWIEYDKDGEHISELRSGNDVVLLQYTGIKDKNGKEIYEGDIVKRWDNDRGVVVIWRDGKAQFDFSESTSFTLDKYPSEHHYEVIGNIYENPEFLKNEVVVEMREIKFRAWYEGEKDKDGNWITEPQMCEVWGWDRTSDNYDTLKIRIASTKRVGTGFLSVPLFIKKVKSDVRLLQYTGLKDKNGREIYEGDIVETDELYQPEIKGSKIIKGIIVFEEGEFYLKGIDGNDSRNRFWSEKHWKVIGNIYENPEFLEKK